MRRTVRLLYFVSVLAGATAATAEDTGWPRDIEAAKGKVTMYQPQLESFDGDLLQARAAVRSR